jgi:hypothetical protein
VVEEPATTPPECDDTTGTKPAKHHASRRDASLGLTQRNYADINDWTRSAWHHLHVKLAQQFNHSQNG